MWGGGVKQDPSLVTRECSGVRGGQTGRVSASITSDTTAPELQTRGHPLHTGQAHELLKTFRHFHKETGLESQSFPPCNLTKSVCVLLFLCLTLQPEM